VADFDPAQLSRTLNKVRTNRQAAAAADTSLELAQRARKAADGLTSYEFLNAYYNRPAAVKRLDSEIANVRRDAGPLRGLGGAPVAATAWASLKRSLGYLWSEIAGIFGALSQPSVAGSMLAELGDRIVAYGEEVGREGVLGGAGKILGDVAKAAGHGGGQLVKGVGAGAKDIAGETAGGLQGIFGAILAKGYVLVIVVVVVVFFVGRALLRKRGLV
jgi:hypothetical protein